MPFRSKAQRRWMYANHPEMAKKWEEHTPKKEKLPERAKKKKKKKKRRKTHKESQFDQELRSVISEVVEEVKWQHLCESTSFLKYLIGKLPNTPKYVIKDLVYQGLLPAGRGLEGHWDWNDLNMSWPDLGPLDQLVWTPNPILIEFRMDMFTDGTKRSLIQRAGGKPPPDFEVPRDAERHQTQAQRLGSRELAFKEPAIMARYSNGKYELFEGWHRTLQAFAKYGDGFKGMAYIAKVTL